MIAVTSPVPATNSRKYLSRWTETFKWIFYNQNLKKVFCATCKEAYVDYKIKCPTSTGDDKSYASFVQEGFCSWGKAIERFKMHEKSNLHRIAINSIISKTKERSVSELVSNQTAQAKREARHCLIKIFETIRFLAIQGLAIRGHTEEHSNIVQLLNLRSTDDLLLNNWMKRSKYKWISHDILNEMLSRMANTVLIKLLSKISEKPFYGFMADETTDVSTKEQMSINFRVVNNDMTIEEIFCGFYECSFTNSETLFEVVKDVLMRFQLPMEKCRGQCYDGANNVSGAITGLQTRIREIEPRALYTHCAGHNLNLSSQDAMREIPELADFLSVMKDLVTFVRASAKRMQIFKDIQCEFDDEKEDECNTISLKKYCPTRWCVRVKSLKSIQKNYQFILKFCDEVGLENGDPGVKARGFLTYLNKFESCLLLEIAIKTLEKVEALNATIQATTINFKSVMRRVDILKSSMQMLRTDEKFNLIWQTTEITADNLDLDNKEPATLRKRKMPKKLNASLTAYFPDKPPDKYRRIYFAVIDQITTSLNERFDSETYKILGKLEDFAIQLCEFQEIECHLYKNNECDFDTDRLILHRSMFFSIIEERQLTMNRDLTSISIFLNQNTDIREFYSEYSKFIRLLLTYPQTVCVAERSFSALKRLKNYLKSSMTQKKTNDTAILYVHRDIAMELDIDSVVDEFILCGATVRNNTFATKREM